MVKRPRSQQPNGQGHTPLCTGAPLCRLLRATLWAQAEGPCRVAADARLRRCAGCPPNIADLVAFDHPGNGELSFPAGSVGSGGRGISSSVAAHDVSGGLAAKLENAAAIAAAGVPVCIVQVGTPHAAEALAGRWPEVCTRVVSRKCVANQ